MPIIYNSVRGLAGAIMTGLGKVSSYLFRNISDTTARTGFLARRYPGATAGEIQSMLSWSQTGVLAGDAFTIGQTPTIATLPADYPLVPSRYSYHISASLPGISGGPATPPFYSIIIGESQFTLEEIQGRMRRAAQEAYNKSKGLSPGSKALLAVTDFQIAALSIWQE